MKFEYFFNLNVGRYIDTRFNNIAIMNKVKIISPLTGRNGFYQYVALTADTDKIIKYYQ